MSEIKTAGYIDGDRYPFTLAELKDYLGISHEAHDPMLSMMAASAADLIERVTREALVRKSFSVTLDFTGELVYTLPRFPFISLTYVAGQDTDGTLTTLTLNTDYYLRGASQKVIEFTSAYDNYQLTLHAGYTAGTCPPALVLACMKQVAFDSENRTSGALTEEVMKLISPFIHYA